ncbi:TRAP dicarboxylate transporter, DctM subunit [uncultured delta proteobacterium]|uniref:TRAP dicarboxylate transporter, DctM subunit n=1 Tax=uncultured delta proteobacterium TaxID=34034 RepID=A0A212JCB4_9DELT|nr:TRAP dicarboxylate transporter, DctM subunit [uncultured delta proteobacterium]
MILFLLSLFALLAIGVPIFVSLGLSALLLWTLEQQFLDFVSIFQKLYIGVDSFTLMAVPFFMLAGEFMNTGGLSKRLVNFAQKILGWIPGGLGFTTIIASMLIAAILGSASASAAMVGMIMIPEMVKRGYNVGYSSALVASAGAVGPIIPPSIPMIIFGVIAQQSIVKLFAAGYIPGIMMGLMFGIYNYMYAKKAGYPAEERPTGREFYAAFKDAGLTLLLPVIIMGGILGGVFTPTEAGVVAVVYAFFVGVLIYREIPLSEIPGVFVRASKSSAMVLMVVTVASFLSWVLTMQRIPQSITALILSQTDSAIVFLLVVNGIMIVLGMFLDAVSALTIMTPVLLPAALALQVDPILFGVMLTVNLSIGVLTPPVGLNLYVAASIANIDIVRVTRSVMPFVGILCAILVLMTFFPKMFLIL